MLDQSEELVARLRERIYDGGVSREDEGLLLQLKTIDLLEDIKEKQCAHMDRHHRGIKDAVIPATGGLTIGGVIAWLARLFGAW